MARSRPDRRRKARSIGWLAEIYFRDGRDAAQTALEAVSPEDLLRNCRVVRRGERARRTNAEPRDRIQYQSFNPPLWGWPYSILRLTRDEAIQLLRTTKENFPAWHSLFMTGIYAGMRLGELLSLQWGDIDPLGGFIEVRRGVPDGDRGETKNRCQRHLDVVSDHGGGIFAELIDFELMKGAFDGRVQVIELEGLAQIVERLIVEGLDRRLGRGVAHRFRQWKLAARLFPAHLSVRWLPLFGPGGSCGQYFGTFRFRYMRGEQTSPRSEGRYFRCAMLLAHGQTWPTGGRIRPASLLVPRQSRTPGISIGPHQLLSRQRGRLCLGLLSLRWCGRLRQTMRQR